MADDELPPPDDALRPDAPEPDATENGAMEPSPARDGDSTNGPVEETAVPASVSSAEEEPTAAPPRPARSRSIGRTVAVVSLRIVRGLVGLAAAAAVVAAVGLVPLPTLGVEPLGTLVEPEPADLLTVCPGALLRLGDDTGANAGQVFPVGTPDVTVASTPGAAQRSELTGGDAAGSSARQAPSALRAPSSDGAVLSAAQQQTPDGEGGLNGLAAASCVAPTSSAWFVGGATTVGRTSILHLVNPTEVNADVSIELWGEAGIVRAPGMSGITVPAGGRVALPLSGFAPDLASPVVHVEARGGQVAAWLQTSVIRVLDPGGVDLVSAGAAPAKDVVIPGVRILGATAVASSLGIEGYDDLQAVVRVGNPGEETAHVEVSLTPATADGVPTSFEITVAGGEVSDTLLSSALELGEAPLPDGAYAVSVRSDVPVVAGARLSTIVDPTPDADGGLAPGAADLAWFASASPVRADAALAVADAPSPMLVASAADGTAHTLTLTGLGDADDITVEVPATGSVAVELPRDAAFLVRKAAGVVAGVSFAGAGELASYPVTAPRAGDTPLVVRP